MQRKACANLCPCQRRLFSLPAPERWACSPSLSSKPTVVQILMLLSLVRKGMLLPRDLGQERSFLHRIFLLPANPIRLLLNVRAAMRHSRCCNTRCSTMGASVLSLMETLSHLFLLQPFTNEN